ncbi:MAG: TVP38/TMEM64 family protein [Legionella sp.]|nr:MAG: TVP38/TMEM64 family protein [Legionella sp.]
MTNTLNFYLKIICTLSALAVLITSAIVFQQHSLEIIDWIDDLGWLAPVLFILIYCLATLLLLPTMVLTLAGGALFGPVIGTIFNLFGATLGAALAFLITRHWLYDWCERKKGEQLNRLITGVNQRGWLFVALLRLFPIIPFNLVNYGLGITGIGFRLYLVTTFIFLIPAEIIYTYFGYAGMGALNNPAQFYKNGGIVLSGLAILFLCGVKLSQFKKPAKP